MLPGQKKKKKKKTLYIPRLAKCCLALSLRSAMLVFLLGLKPQTLLGLLLLLLVGVVVEMVGVLLAGRTLLW